MGADSGVSRFDLRRGGRTLKRDPGGTRGIRRVGVNLLWLVPGVVGGTEEHTTRLLRAFAARSAEHRDFEVVLFVNRSFGGVYPDLIDEFSTLVAPVDGLNKVLRVGAESTWLAWAAKGQGIDLMHHAGGTMPTIRTCPGVVSIHDLQPLTFPEHFGRIKRTYLGLAIPRSARRARRVVVLSNWAREDVVSRTGVPADRVVVVSPGIEPAPPMPSPGAKDQVLERYGLADHPFFIYPAITYPHKNHRTLIEALGRVLRTHSDVRLVLTGGSGPAESAVRSVIDSAGVAASVRRPGRIPVDDLDVLYRSASALLFPSRYEGFGIPVLEAMTRGCPVLVARATALPEVVGDAGGLIDPNDVDAWAVAMRRAIDDQTWRKNCATAGMKRALMYDWSRSASVLEELYRSELP